MIRAPREPLTDDQEKVLLLMETGALYGVEQAKADYWASAAGLGLLRTQTVLAELRQRGLAHRVADEHESGAVFVTWGATEEGCMVAQDARLKDLP